MSSHECTSICFVLLPKIMEVVNSLFAYHGFSADDIETVRASKAEKRGGFKNRIMLVCVVE